MGEQPANVWQFLLICFDWIGGKAGRLINTFIGVCSLLGVSNQISPLLAAKLTLAGAIVGYARSQWTSNTVNTARDIVARAAIPLPPTKESTP